MDALTWSVFRQLVELVFIYGLFLLRLPFRLLLMRLPISAASSEKFRLFREKLLDGPIAHRGGIPENTIEGFRESKSKGAVALEVDVSLTKDGHAVLFHDLTVERTSDGSGRLADMTLEEARKLDVGVKFSARYKGAGIPTLLEGLEAAKGLDILMFLDIKDSQVVPAIANAFAADSSLYDRVVVSSFYPESLYQLKRKDPRIRTGLTGASSCLELVVEDSPTVQHPWMFWPLDKLFRAWFWFLNNWLWYILGASFIIFYKTDACNGRVNVEKLRRNGLGVVLWTVNCPEEKKYFHNILQLPYMTDYVSG